MKNLLILVTLFFLGCSSPTDPQTTDTQADAPPDGCVLNWHKFYTPEGSCFDVKAAKNSVLITCDGTVQLDETRRYEGASYVITSYVLEGGACYQYYTCNAAVDEAPTVTPCP